MLGAEQGWINTTHRYLGQQKDLWRQFQTRELHGLVTIRCLDEGVLADNAGEARAK